MAITKAKLLREVHAAGCTVVILSIDQSARDVEIEAPPGFHFAGSETHALVTTFFTEPGECYAEALDHMNTSLPLEKCDGSHECQDWAGD